MPLTDDNGAPAPDVPPQHTGMPSLPHTIGRYEIRELIGHGGMGVLYLALDPAIGRSVALKVLRIPSDDLRERFAREARSAGRLQHPNIVTIYDVGEYDGQPYIAMEYIAGQTLSQVIAEHSPLTLARKLEIVEELCDGLSFAHRAGIVHRDIKPANIMINGDGLVKILDFGIARVDDSRQTQLGAIIGTPNYMSPEQVRGERIDHRSDIFAVGLTFYELLSYRQAFSGNHPTVVIQRILSESPAPIASLVPGLDPSVAQIVDRALQKAPDARYQDLQLMRHDLAAVRRDLAGAGASPVQVAGPPATSPRRSPTPIPQDLAERRRLEIERHLAAADQALDAGRFEAALESAEQAAYLAPDDPRTLECLERVRGAIDGRQVEQWVSKARQALEAGALTSAESFVRLASGLDAASPAVQAVAGDVQRARAARNEAVAAAASPAHGNTPGEHAPPRHLRSSGVTSRPRARVSSGGSRATSEAADLPHKRATRAEKGKARSGRAKAASASKAAAHGEASEGLGDRIRERLERGLRWLEIGALPMHGVGPVMYLWKRFGLAGLAIILLLAGGPFGEYSLISRFVNGTLPRMAGDFGVTLEAEEWAYHPLQLKAVARKVRLTPEHGSNKEPVFTAAEVEFQGSVGTVLKGFVELASGHWVHTFNEIRISNAALNLERSVTGHLNWTDLLESVPDERLEELVSGVYRINDLAIDNFTINYVEHIPGDSGGGVIQTVQARIHVDAIHGSMSDIAPIGAAAKLPTRLELHGRSADGTIDMEGRLGLSPSMPDGAEEMPGTRRAVLDGERNERRGPLYDVTIRVNNVGAAAYGAMVPVTRLLPSRGSVSGLVRIARRGLSRDVECQSDLRMFDVRFMPNPRVPFTPQEYNELEQQARSYTVSGPFTLCRPEPEAPPADGTPPGPSRASSVVLLASFNEQGTAGAPPLLRRTAALDHQTFAQGMRDAALQQLNQAIAAEVGHAVSGALGASAGAQAQRTLESPGTKGQESSISRGAKSIGRGIKRIFGKH